MNAGDILHFAEATVEQLLELNIVSSINFTERDKRMIDKKYTSCVPSSISKFYYLFQASDISVAGIPICIDLNSL